jgi:hypothetical protein
LRKAEAKAAAKKRGGARVFGRLIRRERGYALIYFAYLLPVFVMLLGISVDFGRARLVKNQLWAACDAAAHAGVAEARLAPGGSQTQLVDDNGDGKPDRAVTTANWFRVVMDEAAARQQAWEAFCANVRERGWAVDFAGGAPERGVWVFSSDFEGRAGSSTNRMDLRQDLYTVSARAYVRTFVLAGAVRMGRAVAGWAGRPFPLPPATESYLQQGMLAVTAAATAQARFPGVPLL